jgi:hypothetical protein
MAPILVYRLNMKQRQKRRHVQYPRLKYFEFEIFGNSIMVTPIGFISIIGIGGSFWGVVFPLVLVGALFGIISAYIGFINSFESGYIDFDQWKGSLWWSFFGGMISNLIFITYIPMLAS